VLFRVATQRYKAQDIVGYEKGHEGEVWWDIKLGKPGKVISKSQ